MSVIQGTVEVMKYTLPENKQMKVHINRINVAIARMTHQIENVLDYVKNKSLRIEKYSIASILDSVLEDSHISENITIKKQIQDFEIECDSNMLKVVFINLIMNAVQSIGDEKGIITIKISEKDSDTIVIQIEDNGPGIPDNAMS